MRQFLCLVVLSLAAIADPTSLSANDVIPTSLKDYVARADDSFQWEVLETQQSERGKVYAVELTSQRWQDIVWKHALQIYEPANMQHPQHVLLFVTGGSIGRRPGQGDVEMGLQLAQAAGARVATLHQVPNQPLFGGRVEDDLITETWLRYLETGDETWPLLLPMVKSAVKAMDAIEALASSQWKTEIKGFVITGGSKRGWTSWLTPVADKRVLGTAPMVIDVLNFLPQMQHQLDSWGKYSEQIHDYTSKNLIKLEGETPREQRLRTVMDPYTYRDALELPKLIINGTNDRYWTLDATQFYWNDLVGPKYALKVPNAGHGLDAGRELALRTVAAFFRHVATGSTWPKIRWEKTSRGENVEFQMTSSLPPVKARIWRATSDSRDFRESRWTSEPLTRADEHTQTAQLARPKSGHLAYFGEMEFSESGLPYSLTTLVEIE